MVRGIVLAAGESRRMGSPKALLPDNGGRVFAARALHTMSAAGLDDVTIVTGSLHEAIVRAVAADAPRGLVIRFARNPDASRGQLSSLQVGLDAADEPGVEAVAVTLVDVPFVSTATMRAVLDAFERTRAPIVRPAKDGRHGHPVVFGREVFADLGRADPVRGAKAVVRARAADIVNVPVDDEGAFTDVDTRDEYERSLRS